jgi:hypothetical protein
MHVPHTLHVSSGIIAAPMTFTADEERLESLLKDLIRFSNDNGDRSTEVNAALAELADVLRDGECSCCRVISDAQHRSDPKLAART